MEMENWKSKNLRAHHTSPFTSTRSSIRAICAGRQNMKAAIVREYKQPLQIEDAEAPSPGPDEVLIKVDACGVCHSDLHIAEGDWTHLLRIIKRPLIPGHEAIGRVVQVGEPVGVAWTHWTCGECELCKEGHENLCSSQSITGATVDGGYAEFMTA